MFTRNISTEDLSADILPGTSADGDPAREPRPPMDIEKQLHEKSRPLAHAPAQPQVTYAPRACNILAAEDAATARWEGSGANAAAGAV